jgi:mRNA interferase HicA
VAGGKGSNFLPRQRLHLKVELNGKTSYLPMHNKDLKTGTVEGIKKQLNLK